MTERLSALLHQEVDRIAVPVPRVQEALVAGRRLRRRRRLTQVAAVGGALAVIGAVGIGTTVLDGSGDPRPPADGHVTDTASPGKPVDLGPVFGDGNRVYFDGGARSVLLDEVAQSFYYTSAGLLVRTNETGASDGGAPFHFVLIDADGQTHSLDLTLGEVVPSTDSRLPYLAYAEADGDAVRVVVHDVLTDQEVARVDVPGLEWSGGWEAPPVSLAGEVVYVGGDETTTVVNWQTGEVSETDLVSPGYPHAGGRSLLLPDENTLEIIDVASGEALVRLTDLDFPWGSISPDGRRALIYEQGRVEANYWLYSLDKGTHVSIDSPPWDYGWTAAGDLYRVDKSGLHECDSVFGTCTETPLPEGITLGDHVVLGGKTYES